MNLILLFLIFSSFVDYYYEQNEGLLKQTKLIISCLGFIPIFFELYYYTKIPEIILIDIIRKTAEIISPGICNYAYEYLNTDYNQKMYNYFGLSKDSNYRFLLTCSEDGSACRKFYDIDYFDDGYMNFELKMEVNYNLKKLANIKKIYMSNECNFTDIKEMKMFNNRKINNAYYTNNKYYLTIKMNNIIRVVNISDNTILGKIGYDEENKRNIGILKINNIIYIGYFNNLFRTGYLKELENNNKILCKRFKRKDNYRQTYIHKLSMAEIISLVFDDIPCTKYKFENINGWKRTQTTTEWEKYLNNDKSDSDMKLFLFHNNINCDENIRFSLSNDDKSLFPSESGYYWML
jgi:hypothetical protein